MKKIKKMPKFPDTLFYLNGCDIDKLAFIAPLVSKGEGLAIYINIWTLEPRVVNLTSITHDPYYTDEIQAIGQASAYIQRKLDQYTDRLKALQKTK